MATSTSSVVPCQSCPDCSGTGYRVVELAGGRYATLCRCRQPAAQPATQSARQLSSSRPPARAPNQRQRILEALRRAGPEGVLNTDLYRICLRPPSRICELRQQGFVIHTIPEAESVFRFVLVSESVQVRPLLACRRRRPRPAQPSLFAEGGR